jgi:hypothetical protein
MRCQTGRAGGGPRTARSFVQAGAPDPDMVG